MTIYETIRVWAGFGLPSDSNDEEFREHQQQYAEIMRIKEQYGGWWGFNEAFVDGKLQPYIDRGLPIQGHIAPSTVETIIFIRFMQETTKTQEKIAKLLAEIVKSR